MSASIAVTRDEQGEFYIAYRRGLRRVEPNSWLGRVPKNKAKRQFQKDVTFIREMGRHEGKVAALKKDARRRLDMVTR